jgi:5'-nucleotidase
VLEGIVLVANDDGVKADGLWFLVRLLDDMGYEVFIASTSRPYSGAGKSITWRFGAKVGNINGFKGVVVDATPSTAVLFALKKLGVDPDFIVTGVNHGANLGIEDIHTSGTFGAALEGVLQGFPSMAISKFLSGNIKKITFTSREEIFLKNLIESFSLVINNEDSLRCMPLNVNLPAGQPKGLAVTRLSMKTYDHVKFVENEGLYSISRNTPGFYDNGLEECNDIWAVYNSYISVTPVCIECLVKGMPMCNEECGLRMLTEGFENGVYCL